MKGFDKRSDRIKTVQGQASQPFDPARNFAGRSRDQRFDPTQTFADRIQLQTDRNEVNSRQLAQKTKMNDGSGGSNYLEQARAQHRKAAREHEIQQLEKEIDKNIELSKDRIEQKIAEKAEEERKERKVLEDSTKNIDAAVKDKETYTRSAIISDNEYKKFKNPYKES